MKKKSFLILIVLLLAVICLTAVGCFPQDVNESPTLSSPEFVFEKVVQKVFDSTVRISCSIRGGTQGGSGVVVSTDGYILTNYHVIKGALNNEASVKFTDFNNPNYEIVYNADIITEKNDGSIYSKMDMALLKIRSINSNLNGFTPVSLKSEKVKWGEYGVIIGNPKQLGTLCAHAMVSNPNRQVSHEIKEVGFTTNFITIDAPVNPGNSGGGFFDSNGKLAGLVTLRQSNNQSTENENIIFGIGYAIPVSSIKGYLARYGITLAE